MPGWWQVFCRRMWVLRVVASFCFRVKTSAARGCMRVWFGISEARMSVFVFRLCLMVCFVLWHAVGYLGQHECCSIDHP